MDRALSPPRYTTEACRMIRSSLMLFLALAKPAGSKVYPTIYPRTSWTWPFSDKHAPAS